MIPRTILRQLGRLRRRERLIRLTWALTLWLSLAAVALTTACFIDWAVDRYRETPVVLRWAMFLGQAALWIGACVSLLAWAFFRRMRDEQLALRVEEEIPDYDHRLISALQLNQPGARTKGMSPSLIEAVTRQAEDKTNQLNFSRLANYRHLKRSAKLAVPLVLAVLVVLAFWSDTLHALLARQLLADQPIPRSVALSNQSVKVWPSGEEGVLLFQVEGPGLRESSEGVIRIYPEGRGSEDYRLVRTGDIENGKALFQAKVPPSSTDFTYRAWVEDGRSRQDDSIHYEPRPAVTKQDAWVVLPRYCGVRPDGNPYEIYQPRGDISAIASTSARLLVKFQKPVALAEIELLGIESKKGEGDSTVRQEVPRRRVPLTLWKDRRTAEGTFALKPDESAYRIILKDDFGFENLDAPRRKIQIVPEQPPVVELLPERLPGANTSGFAEEDEVSGIPILFGRGVRIAYACRHPYGLGRAEFVYRINDEKKRWRLPLAQTPPSPQLGFFDLRRGLFQRSKPDDRVEFYKVPSPDPAFLVGQTMGGGSWDFETGKLPNVKVGDQLEFYVEVQNRNPEMANQPGRSEVRLKTIVSETELVAWIRQTLQQEQRLRQLESRQRGVFPPFERTTASSGIAIPANSEGWKFIRGNAVKGNKWTKASFDDKNWKPAKTPAGYGEEIIKEKEGSLIKDEGQPIYFRREFMMDRRFLKSDTTFKLLVASDNSAVVWINGKRVDNDTDDHEAKYWNREVDIPLKVFEPGRNVIAVQLNNTSGSSDAVFDLQLDAVMPGSK